MLVLAPTISRVQAAVAIIARITRDVPADRGRHAGVWSPWAPPARHDRPRVRADPSRLPRRGAAFARGSARARAEGGAAEAGGRSSECFPAGGLHGACRACYSTPGRAEIAPPGRSWRFPAGAPRPDRIGGRAPAGSPGGRPRYRRQPCDFIGVDSGIDRARVGALTHKSELPRAHACGNPQLDPNPVRSRHSHRIRGQDANERALLRKSSCRLGA